jgi:hypothetical protein
MTRGITLALAACLILQSVMADAQDLRTSLTRGERIAVELTDREQLTGIVGARLNSGFELQLPDSDNPRFIKYSEVRALLDPDTREVLSHPTYSGDPADRRWVAPVLISLATVGVLALLTRGLFPACLFQSCR